jgi:hypothetical protein
MYQRNSGFVEAVRAPLFYDALNIRLKGLFSRELSFESGASASIGHVGIRVQDTANGFDTWTGYASLGRALGRHLEIRGYYTYYRYTFEPTAALATGLRSDVNRHSVNMTVRFWTPVLQRGRRIDATR